MLKSFILNKIRKVGCAFPIVICCEFRMGQYRVDDHQDDAPNFSIITLKRSFEGLF